MPARKPPPTPERQRVLSTPERTLRRLEWTVIRRLDGLDPSDGPTPGLDGV